MTVTAATLDPTGCETCAIIARDLDRGEVWECPFCGGVLERPRPVAVDDPLRTRPQRPRRERDGWLSLLRDCLLVSRWDALAAPRSIPLPTPPLRSSEAAGELTAIPGGASRGGMRGEVTERPEWAEGAWVARACRLRERLSEIWTRGRAGDVDVHKAAAVIEWLVPRARVLLDSPLHGGAPAERDLPMLVAAAHTEAGTWARWNPVYPDRDANDAFRRPTVVEIVAWRAAVERGKVGARRHGVELLDLAAGEWGRG